jgi:hypothetical protein
MKSVASSFAVACVLVLIAHSVPAQQEHEHHTGMHTHDTASPAMEDGRTLVHFPERLRVHTLANMRDHLLALQQIQQALGDGQYEQAGEIAENRLGMTSLELHGAHEVGQYMPQAMAAIGTRMHKAASRFALAANDAAVAGDVKPALTALAGVTRQCVACHTGFRVQ